jgi:hypothetical protein
MEQRTVVGAVNQEDTLGADPSRGTWGWPGTQ